MAPPNFRAAPTGGRDALTAGYSRRWGASWEEMRIGVGRTEEAGDWILASVEYAGPGEGIRHRGPPTVVGAVALARGQVLPLRGVWDRDQGLAAFAQHEGRREIRAEGP